MLYLSRGTKASLIYAEKHKLKLSDEICFVKLFNDNYRWEATSEWTVTRMLMTWKEIRYYVITTYTLLSSQLRLVRQPTELNADCLTRKLLPLAPTQIIKAWSFQFWLSQIPEAV